MCMNRVLVGVYLGEGEWHKWYKDQWGWDTSLCTCSGFCKGSHLRGRGTGLAGCEEILPDIKTRLLSVWGEMIDRAFAVKR
jgi:hypothetical protein